MLVDADYRGSLGVVLTNLDSTSFNIHRGDRIGQLIPIAYFVGGAKEVAELTETARNTSGFGSTGK